MLRPIVTLIVTNLETGEREKIFALLDTGSDRDFLSLKVANRLGLTLGKKLIETTTVRGPEVVLHDIANFNIEAIDGSYSCDVREGIVGELSVVEWDIPAARRDLSALPHLADIFFNDAEEGSVEAIIGIGHGHTYPPLRI